mmetsp:Transcript_36494/g.95549  ORF Transcript_36494/g.95549 Transcript_36494/m.95549 type:complete len:261 (-) Transcript_36494:1661-2443(-)
MELGLQVSNCSSEMNVVPFRSRCRIYSDVNFALRIAQLEVQLAILFLQEATHLLCFSRVLLLNIGQGFCIVKLGGQGPCCTSIHCCLGRQVLFSFCQLGISLIDRCLQGRCGVSEQRLKLCARRLRLNQLFMNVTQILLQRSDLLPRTVTLGCQQLHILVCILKFVVGCVNIGLVFLEAFIQCLQLLYRAGHVGVMQGTKIAILLGETIALQCQSCHLRLQGFFIKLLFGQSLRHLDYFLVQIVVRSVEFLFSLRRVLLS